MHSAGRLGVIALLGGLLAGGTFLSAPAYAAASADLTVALSNKVDAKPGKRVKYEIVVHNIGPSTAQRVQIDFFTTAPLGSVEYAISSGHCYRSSKETACLFGTIASSKSATVTISGLMPKKMAKGTAVSNKVTVASNTHLINTADDVAIDNYQIGVARPVAQPVASPTPSTQGSKLARITHAAASAISVTDKALVISLAALAAALIWFVVGLTLRRRHRRRATPDTN
jgi:hypothetical protein